MIVTLNPLTVQRILLPVCRCRLEELCISRWEVELERSDYSVLDSLLNKKVQKDWAETIQYLIKSSVLHDSIILDEITMHTSNTYGRPICDHALVFQAVVVIFLCVYSQIIFICECFSTLSTSSRLHGKITDRHIMQMSVLFFSLSRNRCEKKFSSLIRSTLLFIIVISMILKIIHLVHFLLNVSLIWFAV